ncbi:nucleoside triphosphate pyrophosphohydrolase [Wenjunlia tyrosinilytica]|uniref:Nucleoside triphosphate pyrophosphohydrolase n=1 Tax=Wenjunlia tyrosinilytica TaxID=1544741 RepID=A0A917ZNV3_9ACTN|nr:nucleoside triphosphate pyrophosphohydrolase [Wenjunlia tyrosinilytica]GGO88280.1 nucleoside triphosphate pyrophosphohydrolase [Wenjunlia tyrosinilytica]
MDSNTDSPGRLVLLTTTHRVAPGLLSWPAWQTLREADRVISADAEHPQLPYLREAGVEVEIASPSARELVEYCSTGRTAVLVVSYGGDPGGVTDDLARLAGSGQVTAMPELELLPASYDLPGARLLDLVAVMDRLRSPGGCPWDAEQTHASLVKYLIEEAYELVETIEQGDREALREELGDVLLQVMFHARIAQEDEQEPFSIDDVAGGIVDKLVYRHPHVFASVDADTPEQVEANWEELKAAEKHRDSVTDGVPMGQPALALAAKLLARADKAGIDVPVPAPVAPPERPDDEAAIGRLLLAVAALACANGVDPEAALRAEARRHRDRIVESESRKADGRKK